MNSMISQSSSCPRRTFLKGSYITLLFVLLNSQIFSATSNNPMGIKGVQEGFYVILCFWAVSSIINQYDVSGHIRRMDLMVFLMVVILAFYGAFMAKIQFGQTITYGLLEERRIFAVWIYFPLTTALRRNWIDVQQLENMVIGVAILCALLTVGVFIDVLPAINSINNSEIALRGERYGIGQLFMAVSVLFLFTRKGGVAVHKQLSSILFLVAVLLVIVQTRQILVSMLLGLVFLLRGGRAAAMLGALVLSLILVPYFFPQAAELLERYTQLFATAASDEYLAESWRGMSIRVVLDTVSAGAIYGNGSLSPFWNGGFHELYGPFFFLADIGLIGTIYRYGVLGIFVYMFYFIVQFRLLHRICDKKKKKLYFAVYVMLIAAAPLGAPLEYRGFVAGFLLAVTYSLSLRSKFNVLHSIPNQRV